MPTTPENCIVLPDTVSFVPVTVSEKRRFPSEEFIDTPEPACN